MLQAELLPQEVVEVQLEGLEAVGEDPGEPLGVVELRLTAGDVTEDPAQAALAPGPSTTQEFSSILRMSSSSKSHNLPGEEDVDVVESSEDVHALLQCAGGQ